MRKDTQDTATLSKPKKNLSHSHNIGYERVKTQRTESQDGFQGSFLDRTRILKLSSNNK